MVCTKRNCVWGLAGPDTPHLYTGYHSGVLCHLNAGAGPPASGMEDVPFWSTQPGHIQACPSELGQALPHTICRG